jgi:hypothetical protein
MSVPTITRTHADPVRESARERVGRHDQHWPHHQSRAGMRDAEDDPLRDRVQEDAHQQEVHHDPEAASHDLAPKLAMKEHGVEIRWSPRARRPIDAGCRGE